MRRLLFGALTLAIAGAAPPSAHAAGAPAFAAASTVTAPGEASSGSGTQVVMDPTYGVTVVWTQTGLIRSAHRDPGGDWQPPEQVGPAADAVDVPANAVVSAPNGDVTVVWRSEQGGIGEIRSATRSASTGHWGGAAIVSSTGVDAYSPAIVSNSASRLYVIWTENDGGDQRVRMASRAGSALSWTDEGWISSPGAGTAYPRLAVSADDDLAVSWASNGASPPLYVRVREGGVWGSIENFGQTCIDRPPASVAAGPGSSFVLAYVQCTGAGPEDYRVRAATRAAGGPGWSSPTTLSAQPGVEPIVAVNSLGDALVTWLRISAGPTFALAASTRRAGQSWSGQTALTGTDGLAFATAPVVLADNAFMLPFMGGSVFSALTVQGYDWIPGDDIWQNYAVASGSIHALSPPLAASSGAGDVAVAWPDYGTHTVSVAIADGTPPHLGGLTVPVAATAGASDRFSVEPTDDWSAIASTTWTFGDGTTATGAETTHTYATPGSYTVTLTVLDANGNEATATRQVTVAATGGDTQTTPAVTPPTVVSPLPHAEVRLRGRTLTISAALTLKRGARCAGKGRASTRVGGRRYMAKLTLKGTAQACVASGTIRLKAAPKARARVVVRVTARRAVPRLLAATRS